MVLPGSGKEQDNMGTIIDYIHEYGDYSFSKLPMTEVDSLVFAQFCYLKFDHLLPGIEENKKSVTIRELADHRYKNKLFADERFADCNRALFAAMLQSVRFGSIEMNYHVNRIDVEKETQFCAVTIFAQDIVYLAYRGTDETIIGWKEDFNLAFSEPVPGQLCSVSYMNLAAQLFTGNFYAGGHSKGGNFAVYAAMNCKEEVKERIEKIYNHDGPGFRPEIRERGGYDKIAQRVVKVIPHSALIGMILDTDGENDIVVESKTFGLLQHNPFTWLVKDGAFVRAKNIYRGSRFRDDTLNQWILSLDEAHIRAFVDTLYEVISAADAATLTEFSANKKKSMQAVLAALKELDSDTAARIKTLVASLFGMAGERLKEEMQGLVLDERKKKGSRRRAQPQSPASVQRDKK